MSALYSAAKQTINTNKQNGALGMAEEARAIWTPPAWLASSMRPLVCPPLSPLGNPADPLDGTPPPSNLPTHADTSCECATPIRTCPDFCVSDLVPACLCGRCTTNAEGCTAKGMWSWVATCISCCTLFQ